MLFPSTTLYPSEGIFPEIRRPQALAVRFVPQATNLNGIVFNQNQTATGETPVDGSWRYQEFLLPSDLWRGTDANERRLPALSGLQLCLRVGNAQAVEVDYVLERQVFGLGWVQEATGSVSGAHAEGTKVWVDLYLEQALKVPEDAVANRWRFGFRGTADGAWGSAPNPLSVPHGLKAYAGDGSTPLTIGGSEFSYLFRVLGLVADEGIDFLGNAYRSLVINQDPNSVSPGTDDTFWLSKPNPSKFAVESLYFDVRPDPTTDSEAVIDSVVVDPITPGVYFHVYYTSEGDPETTPEAWDQKLWKRVPRTYQMLKRETHVLPEPINAKYVKVEFSHLQAKYYQPGDFAQPVAYKKHPKWVLDYFLLRVGSDQGVSDRVGVVWDTLDLAYNYYLDDQRQEPLQPVALNPADADAVTSFLRDQSDSSDQVDLTTLGKINQVLQPFSQNPALSAKYDFLLGSVVRSQAQLTPDYPVEAGDPPPVRSDDVMVLRDESIVVEQNYPVMFFYLTCRHAYREVLAPLSHDRAYFVGVREIAFTRERYTTAHDTPLYIEAVNDENGLERNDFLFKDDQWVVYDE